MFIQRLAAFVAALLVVVAPAQAQTDRVWPDKPINLVVGFTPGGPSDVLARLLGKKMGDALGQTVVVVSRPGAGGNIAAAAVAKSAPDGYTWLFGNNSILSTNAALYKTLPFDPEKDFDAVGLVAVQPSILVVNSNVPAKTLQELIALIRAKPGEMNYASSGAGAAAHLVGQWFKTSAGLTLEHVPYKGAQPALTDLIAGQVQMMFATSASALPFITQGRLRALAVTGPRRMDELPQVPTMVEAGMPQFVAESWHGVVVPTGTPPAIIRRMNQVMVSALKSPDVLAQFKELGVDAAPGTPEAFASFIRSETPKWTQLVRDSGAFVE